MLNVKETSIFDDTKAVEEKEDVDGQGKYLKPSKGSKTPNDEKEEVRNPKGEGRIRLKRDPSKIVKVTKSHSARGDVSSRTRQGDERRRSIAKTGRRRKTFNKRASTRTGEYERI